MAQRHATYENSNRSHQTPCEKSFLTVYGLPIFADPRVWLLNELIPAAELRRGTRRRYECHFKPCLSTVNPECRKPNTETKNSMLVLVGLKPVQHIPTISQNSAHLVHVAGVLRLGIS